MKIFLLSLTMFTFVYAAHIDEFAAEVGYLRDYNTAIKKAKEEKKLLMFVLVGDYCPWCKKFERKTLKSSKVAPVVKENFVTLVLDKYKEKEKYPKAFYTPVIPSVFFIDPDTQKAIIKTTAYMKKDEFLEHMDDALSLYAQETK